VGIWKENIRNIPLIFLFRFSRGSGGYHPCENLVIKDASRWVSGHFRHNHQHIYDLFNRFNALIFPWNKMV